MKILSTLAVCAAGWTYDDQSLWGMVSSHCNKKSQSPIDITGATVEKLSGSKINQHNYGVDHSWKGTNNGHTIKFTPQTTDYKIDAKTLEDGEYTLGQFHFHWGSAADKGSEHTVDGKRYFAEVHLVHFKSEYGDIGRSLYHSDGLAVVGHFLEVVDTTDETPMDKFLQNIVGENLLEESSEFEFYFNLADLGLTDFDDYYRYSGSLTTPPCNEVVQWTVVKDTIKINKDTMEKMIEFSKTKTGDLVVDNFREIQPLNGREITLYSADKNGLDKDLLMLMMMSGQGQMNPLMLSLLLDDEKLDRSKLLLLSMMSGQGTSTMNSMLPLLLMKDSDLSDNKMLMLMMMQGGDMNSMNLLLMMSLLE